MNELTVCLIFRFISVKNEANSSHDLVDNRKVSLSTLANKAHALLFLAMTSEKKDCLASLSSKF